jgi:hypothetical protein
MVSHAARIVWLVTVLTSLSFSGAVYAAAPRVDFDTSYTAECRDVTPCAFAAAHPDLMVVETTFRISTRLLSGREADLEELLIEITSPDQRLSVVDFVPRTELDTDIAGEIEVVETNDHTKSTNTGLGGTVGIEYGLVKAQATPSAGGGKTDHAGTKKSYKQIPPKQLLLASGTIDRGQGVFFKLKPSTNASLEGMREFACLFLVPRDLTGQWVQIACQARASKKSYFSIKPPHCGEGLFHVGLFLEGDSLGRAAAEETTRAQDAVSESAKGGFAAPISVTAFKPFVDHAVDASRHLFVCPTTGKRDHVSDVESNTHWDRLPD